MRAEDTPWFRNAFNRTGSHPTDLMRLSGMILLTALFPNSVAPANSEGVNPAACNWAWVKPASNSSWAL